MAFTVTTIGCAGSRSQLGVESSGHLIQIGEGSDEFRLMMDFGVSHATLGSYLNPYQDLNAIIATHLHPDHWKGFIDGFMDFWLADPQERDRFLGGERSVYRKRVVYAPSQFKQQLLQTVNTPTAITWEEYQTRHGSPYGHNHDLVLLLNKAFEQLFDFRPIESLNGPQQIGPLIATFTQVDHPVATFGVRFDAEDGSSFCYSSDTGTTHKLVELANNATVLMCNAPHRTVGVSGKTMHHNPEEAAEMAAKANANTLVISHLNPEAENPHWDRGLTTVQAREHKMVEIWQTARSRAVREALEALPPDSPITVIATKPGLTFDITATHQGRTSSIPLPLTPYRGPGRLPATPDYTGHTGLLRRF